MEDSDGRFYHLNKTESSIRIGISLECQRQPQWERIQFRAFVFHKHGSEIVIAENTQATKANAGGEAITEGTDVEIIVVLVPAFTTIIFVNHFCMGSQFKSGN